jgi:hypothetical protein
MPLANSSWEFYSLLAGMVFILVRQWLGDKAREVGIATAQNSARDAAQAAQNAHMETKVLGEKQDEQHKATNSRLSELIESIKKEQFALGQLAGTKAEQERVANLTAVIPVAVDDKLREMRGNGP